MFQRLNRRFRLFVQEELPLIEAITVRCSLESYFRVQLQITSLEMFQLLSADTNSLLRRYSDLKLQIDSASFDLKDCLGSNKL